MIKYINLFNGVLKDIVKVLSIIGLIMTIIIKVRTLLGLSNKTMKTNISDLTTNVETDKDSTYDNKPDVSNEIQEMQEIQEFNNVKDYDSSCDNTCCGER